MIRRRVSAVVLLRDGFTGRAFPSTASVACVLDGRRCRPLSKPGGYLVLTDLEPGEHALLLSCRSYRDCLLRFTVGNGGFYEREIGMEPGSGYPFPKDAPRLRFSLALTGADGPAEGTELLAAMAGPASLKLAQDPQTDAAETRVFCRGPVAALPVPGAFLVADGGARGPEAVRILELDGETARLERPMEKEHPRGTELLPLRSVRLDVGGRAELVFPGAGKLFLLCGAAWKTLELGPGTQELEWKL